MMSVSGIARSIGSLRTRRVLALASAALAVVAVRAPAQTGGGRILVAAPAIGGDTLRLYYMGYAIGHERWSLARGENGSRTFQSELDYSDRGRRTRLRSELRVSPDWTPSALTVERITDSSRVREASVVLNRRVARVDYRGRQNDVSLPPVAFAIAGSTPIAQHMALLHYWLRHGRPATLAVVPGGPTNVVRIAWRGRDTVRALPAGAPATVLDRYEIEGVVWGREAAWLDAQGRLAAFATAGGGGLTLEGVRLPLEAALPALRASATRDRLFDLARLSRQVRPVAQGEVAVVGATIIDGTGRAPIADGVVLVRDGRIVAVGGRAEVRVPPTARRLDARGRTIVPGLWDMHTHLMQIEWAPVYLAAGVTTVRDMGNVNDFIRPFRAFVDSGGGLGPRMLLAGLIDGGGPNAFGAENATTPDEGRAIVRKYHGWGFEQVKLYSLLTPAVVAAIADEAHRAGMTVTGHIPTSLSLFAAIDSGMDQVAHLPIRGDAASDSVRRIVAHLAAEGTVIDPTASWGELLQHARAEPVAAFQPGVARLPPVLAQRIEAMGIAGIDTATAHARLRGTLGLLRALHEAGVPVVAGTDEGVPGFSVYREIELYSAAGFSNLEAIRAATAVAAQAMGIADRVGTLEPGKAADLVILDGDPLARISDIRRVELVMKGGVTYRSADIWRTIGFR